MCRQIHILGTVGAGKSSLSKLLSSREQIYLYPEPVETNPYLSQFYENPWKYAFQMQVFLVHSRFKQSREALSSGRDSIIMDMDMYGNDIFAELMHRNRDMSEDDYQTYTSLSNSLKALVPPPDLMVYLQCKPEIAVNRIMKRGRPSELRASLQYWCDLNESYEWWYESYSDSKKILINVDNIDFVGEEDDEDYTLDIIMEEFNNV